MPNGRPAEIKKREIISEIESSYVLDTNLDIGVVSRQLFYYFFYLSLLVSFSLSFYVSLSPLSPILPHSLPPHRTLFIR